MELSSRRDFNRQVLGSLLSFGLIETLWARGLLADSVQPVVHQWVRDLQSLSRDLKDRKMKDTEFQAKLEELYRKVNLNELLKLLDLDKLAKSVRYPELGAASLGFDLRNVEGLPTKLTFGKQIFAVKKGRSIVPHGHDNMCTGFIVLRGRFQGKHYDRVEDHEGYYLMKPTIDRRFEPGECSTVSDHKDNVHWFIGETDTAFIFNIHVDGYNPDSDKVPRRVYVDPDGEKVNGGLIRAKKISSKEAHKKYG